MDSIKGMKVFFGLVILLSTLSSCSKESDSDEPEGKELAEKIVGVWRQKKQTSVLSDGAIETTTEGCSTLSEYRFSSNGLIRNDDYEGSDISDCDHFIFEGRWELGSDPENSDTNIRLVMDTLDGQPHEDDWDYSKITFSGDNKMIIHFTTTGFFASFTYEYTRIQ